MLLVLDPVVFLGLLAFGIEKMDGTAGLEGWRWIFIIVRSLISASVSVA